MDIGDETCHGELSNVGRTYDGCKQYLKIWYLRLGFVMVILEVRWGGWDIRIWEGSDHKQDSHGIASIGRSINK